MNDAQVRARLRELQQLIDRTVEHGESDSATVLYAEGAMNELARAFPLPMPDDAVGIAANDSGAYIGCRRCALQTYDDGYQNPNTLADESIGWAARLGLVRFVQAGEAIEHGHTCETCGDSLVAPVRVHVSDCDEIFEAVHVLPERWNGWAQPVFSAEVIEDILGTYGEQFREVTGRDPREDVLPAPGGFLLNGWTWCLVDTQVQRIYEAMASLFDELDALADPRTGAIGSAAQQAAYQRLFTMSTDEMAAELRGTGDDQA